LARRGEFALIEDDHFGQMNDRSAGAWVAGPCGDTMEFYRIIEDDVITRAKYHTDGCEFTRLCGHAAVTFIEGKLIPEALTISVRQVLESIPGLPAERRHCAILAVSTFHGAIG
jgi:nitrogen fixation NifU-like protein